MILLPPRAEFEKNGQNDPQSDARLCHMRRAASLRIGARVKAANGQGFSTNPNKAVDRRPARVSTAMFPQCDREFNRG